MKVEEIPCDKIDLGPTQSRQREVQKDIGELAENIKTHGLLHPITVYKENGRYVCIAGQRRFMAFGKLGRKTIPANVIAKPSSDIAAKAISFSETFVRSPMVDKDLIDTCTTFYNHYGTMKAVAEELGLPYHKVRKWVKAARLPPKVRMKVDKGDVGINKALKAVDYATNEEGIVDEDMADRLAEQLQKMTGTQLKNIDAKKNENPDATPEELIDAGLKPPTHKVVRVELLMGDFGRLKRLSDDQDTVEEDMSAELIIDALEERGY